MFCRIQIALQSFFYMLFRTGVILEQKISHSACIFGFGYGRFNLLKVFQRFFCPALLQQCVGGVKIGCLVVGIHPGCHVEHMVEVLRTGLICLCHGKHLFKAETLRGSFYKFLSLVELETAYHVVYAVVRAAKSGIAVVQYNLIRLGELLLHLPLLAVYVLRSVLYVGEYGVLVCQCAGLEIFHQAFPVLRLVRRLYCG